MRDANRIDAFLEMMAAERGASDNTLAAYRRDLEHAAEALSGRWGGIATAPSDALRGFAESLAEDGFAATSQARKLSALRQFYKFLYLEGIRADDPTTTLDAPRRGRPLPKTLSEDEVARLLDRTTEEAVAPPAGLTRFETVRMHALLELLYATGLRVSELVALPVSVALRDERFFVVRGKGSKDRMVPLSTKARSAAQGLACRAERVPGFRESPYLFPSSSEAATCRVRSLRAN
jgi:integrase/recombinase XerD